MTRKAFKRTAQALRQAECRRQDRRRADPRLAAVLRGPPDRCHQVRQCAARYPGIHRYRSCACRRAKFVDVWGKIDSLSADKAAFAKCRTLLTGEAITKGNAVKGRAIYERTCSACHKLYGAGGEIGRISRSNRANLDYILKNILNPSGDIPEGYQMILVTTRQTCAPARWRERAAACPACGRPAPGLAKSEIQSPKPSPHP